MKKEIYIFVFRTISAVISLFAADYLAQRFFDNNFWWQLGILFIIVMAFSPIYFKVIKTIETKCKNNKSDTSEE